MFARQFQHFVQTTKTTQPRPQVSSVNGSIWRFNMTVELLVFFELCVWFFYPIRNREIFWMNNNNGYWTVYIMDSTCTCYCTPCKWCSCTLVGYSTAKFFTFLHCLYSVILWSKKFLGKCTEESNRDENQYCAIIMPNSSREICFVLA